VVTGSTALTHVALADPETKVSTAPGDREQQPLARTDVLRVLHVEDNPADALLMQEYLRGVLPEVAFDTAVRLTELDPDRAAAADCVLLDLSLPDASGLEAVIALRGMSDNLPIIVLTGFDDLEVALSAVRGGADDYLLKSHVDGYSLERAVKYAVERRRLMLAVASSEFTAVSATEAAKLAMAATLAAEAAHAAEAARQAQRTVALSSGVAGRHEEHRAPHDAAVGTHEVSVRIDSDSGDYALRCASCDWEAERGPDDVHSWTDRSLDLVLLHHVVRADAGVPTPTPPHSGSDSLPRRRLLRPVCWLAEAGGGGEGRNDQQHLS
jgi:CheY-like chemotaxis protein